MEKFKHISLLYLVSKLIVSRISPVLQVVNPAASASGARAPCTLPLLRLRPSELWAPQQESAGTRCRFQTYANRRPKQRLHHFQIETSSSSPTHYPRYSPWKIPWLMRTKKNWSKERMKRQPRELASPLPRRLTMSFVRASVAQATTRPHHLGL